MNIERIEAVLRDAVECRHRPNLDDIDAQNILFALADARRKLANMTERYNVRKELADHLNQQLSEKNAEIERLNASPTIEACRQMIRDKAVIEASELHNQLAASQALKAEWLAKGAEAMRERVVEYLRNETAYCAAHDIRALPGVTLDELEGV